MMFMRSLSWRKRSETTKDAINESQQKPQSWVDDEKKIKISSCSYNVEVGLVRNSIDFILNLLSAKFSIKLTQ